MQARAMYSVVDEHMKRLWTIWKSIILCWQHQKRRASSTIIIVIPLSKRMMYGSNDTPHQMSTIGTDGNNLFGMFSRFVQKEGTQRIQRRRRSRRRKEKIKHFYLTFDIFSDLCMRWKAKMFNHYFFSLLPPASLEHNRSTSQSIFRHISIGTSLCKEVKTRFVSLRLVARALHVQVAKENWNSNKSSLHW